MKIFILAILISFFCCDFEKNKLEIETGLPPASYNRKAKGQLQINLNNEWKNLCCEDDKLVMIDKDCDWLLDRRALAQGSLLIWAEEMEPGEVICGKELNRLHGEDTNVGTSILKTEGGPIYPDNAHGTCFAIRDGIIESVWTEINQCNDFRI